MRRKYLILSISAGAVIALFGLAFMAYTVMTGPMYSPGKTGKASTQAKAALVRESSFLMPDGANLGYAATGSGTPVLMLHGGPGYPFTGIWKGLEGTAGYRFFFYDQRGCGTSDKPFDRFEGKNFYANLQTLEGKLGIAAQLRDIESIRLGLGVEKITLIGHSFGGFLAALYAAEYPKHVDKLILVAPAAVMFMPDPEGDLYAQVGNRLQDPDDKARFAAFMKRYFDFQSVFGKTESELSAQNAEFAEYFAIAAEKDGAGTSAADSAVSFEKDTIGGFMAYALYFSMGSRHDYRSALKSIDAKTLIFSGTNDLAGKEAVIRNQYGNHIRGSRMIMLEGTGHFMFDEKPGEFRDATVAFMREGT